MKGNGEGATFLRWVSAFSLRARGSVSVAIYIEIG